MPSILEEIAQDVGEFEARHQFAEWLTANLHEHGWNRFLSEYAPVAVETQIVYFLRNDKRLPIYIGVTENLPQRMRAHRKKWWWPVIDAAQSSFWAFSSRQWAEDAEAFMIDDQQPEMNRAGRHLVVQYVNVPEGC